MRIGELAALAGASTRTVRHYHHLGLLPEPVRQANGYRRYGLRDAVSLARVRRLAELGLSLDEIRDVLADDQGKELRDVLLELDADLARQQEQIAARRTRLAALLAEAELHPDSTVSPGMAAMLRDLSASGSRFAAFDREMLALLDTVAGRGGRLPDQRGRRPGRTGHDHPPARPPRRDHRRPVLLRRPGGGRLGAAATSGSARKRLAAHGRENLPGVVRREPSGSLPLGVALAR